MQRVLSVIRRRRNENDFFKIGRTDLANMAIARLAAHIKGLWDAGEWVYVCSLKFFPKGGFKKGVFSPAAAAAGARARSGVCLLVEAALVADDFDCCEASLLVVEDLDHLATGVEVR